MKILCHSCGKELPRGSLKYVIEIKSFADFDGYLEEYPGDVEEGINDLLDAIEHADPGSIEQEVFEESIFILCKNCRDKFTKDPFKSGKMVFEKLEAKDTIH